MIPPYHKLKKKWDVLKTPTSNTSTITDMYKLFVEGNFLGKSKVKTLNLKIRYKKYKLWVSQTSYNLFFLPDGMQLANATWLQKC